jgi:tetratricopeptide (TPR) repeat protein
MTVVEELFDADEYRHFKSLSVEQQRGLVVNELCKQSHLLIFDALESIPEPEKTALHDFLIDLVAGQSKTLILLGSQNETKWLAGSTFEDNVYPLAGIDPKSALTLVTSTLERHKINRRDETIYALPRQLEGNPLLLDIVTRAIFENQTAMLSALEPEMTRTDKQRDEKQQVIFQTAIRCIYNTLAPNEQALLLNCLAPFKHTIKINALAKTDVNHLPFDSCVKVLEKMADWKLLHLFADKVFLQSALAFFIRNEPLAEPRLVATVQKLPPATTAPPLPTPPSFKNEAGIPPKPKEAPSLLIGQRQHDLLIGLRDKWMVNGPTVCFVEGFSGVGKTKVAQALLESMESIGTTVVRVDMPDTETNPVDDLLLELATELEMKNNRQLVDAIDNGQDLLKIFEQILFFKPVLIIIDEFQRAFTQGKAIPIKKLAGFLDKLNRRGVQKGRLLLLCNRSLERGRWLESHEVRTLPGLKPEEAEILLDKLLTEKDSSDEVAPERRREVVHALGCNPRALHVLVECLRREPLDDLIGAMPDLWSFDDRDISAELLRELETALLERVLEHLSKETRGFLDHIAVYRKSVQQKAFKKMADNSAKVAQCRNELIDRFLIELHKGWYSLNPVVREIVLHRFNEQTLLSAHSFAADYYMRHFQAKQMVGGGELGGYFVEARFHLVRAGRAEVLKDIYARFEQYLRTTITSVSPVPKNETELNERIALLSGLLEHGGLKGLAYHLARCYQARRSPGDIEKALKHIRKATGSHAPADSWLLRIILEGEIHGAEQALKVTRQAVSQVSAVELYEKGGELLANANRLDEAIDLLRDGIQKIPADKGLFSLYQSCGELLTRASRLDEAIDLLRDGIQKIPVDKGVIVLYQSCGELLTRANRFDEAIDLQREGIQKIPADKGLVHLYQSCGELLSRASRLDEAIDLLRDGIQKIPADKNLFALYQSCGELLTHANRLDEAIDLLRDGIQKIPVDKGLVHLYQSCGELLSSANRFDEAIDLLRDGIQKIPADKGLFSLYQSCGELLTRASRPQEALEFLREGMRSIPVGKWNRYTLIHLALYLSAAEQDIHTIDEILAGQSKDASEPQQTALGQVLRLQLQGHWQKAAETAQTARTTFPTYIDIATQEAFSWLCAGDSAAAQQAFERFPNEIQLSERNPAAWLKAFIALKQDNLDAARESLSIYLNQPLNHDDPIDERALLRLWDEDAKRGGQHPAGYFPNLPPSLTGLPQTVTRTEYGPSVLAGLIA